MMINLALITFGKVFSKTIQTFNLGNGSTWPGHIALKANKNFVRDVLATSHVKTILIAGTNGKTTTTALIRKGLEENGKTKIVNLINTAQPNILKKLQIGQSLKICVKRSKIFVLDETDQFIGMLPDNVGRRLMKFILEGNLYGTYVKAVEKHTVTVFIREVKRDEKFKDISSFLYNDTTTLPITKHKKQVAHSSKVDEEE